MSSSEEPGLSNAQKYWLSAAEPRLAALCSSRSDLPTAELEARRQALAAESAAIRSFLWKFETSLNELQPISLLPSEVLTYIFSIVEALCSVAGDDWRDISRKQFSTFDVLHSTRVAKPKYVDWLSVTRVCSRWRKEALACSSLWSRIPLDLGTKGIHTFLRRSRNSSLIISCTPHNRTSRLMEVMQPAYLARTRELRIPTTALNPNVDSVLSMLQNPAPQLEVLSLRVGQAAGSHIRMATPIKLPESLLNNDAPQLRIFDVHQLDRWPAYPALFAKLRVFSVINDSVRNYTFPLWSEMRRVLQSMPLLEALRLNNSMARGHDIKSDEGPIALPRLQLLELSGPITACSAVLRPLRVAPRCKMFISCVDELTAVRDHTAALVADLYGTGFNIKLTPKSLAVTLSDGQLHVAAFEEQVEDPRSLHTSYGRAIPHSTDPVLSRSTIFSFRVNTPRRQAFRGLNLMVEHAQRLFAQALPMHAIESASVFSIPSPPGDNDARSIFEPLWTGALASCSRLSKLHVAGPAAYVLLRKLAELQPEGPLLPALSLFVFDDAQISRVRMFENVSTYDILLAALQRCAIPSVQMPQSPLLNIADMSALRALTDLQTYPRASHWTDAGVELFLGDDVGLLPEFNEEQLILADTDESDDEIMIIDDAHAFTTAFQPIADNPFADDFGV